jgi:hypothetical protein
MLTVSHKITIGTAGYTSSDHSRLLDLQMKASLDVPVNVCGIVLGLPAGLNIAPEDPVKVELGYEDNLVLVLTGTVGSVDWGIDTVSIQAAGSFQWLLAARFNLFYEKPKAGDIVADVVGRLGLSAGKVENGLEFPAYALGENQTAYDHLRRLAWQCGFDLYADPADKVVFARYSPADTHEFQYGLNILSLTLDEQTTPLTGVEVYGASPTSHGQGPEAYAWLTKKEVKGTAGSASGLVRRLFDPTARTLETAAQIAEATLAVASRGRPGRLEVLGAPKIKLGDAVKVSGMPVETQNGTFKVMGIAHALNARKGFFTVVEGEEV